MSLTAEQKARFAEERRERVGELILRGELRGALVIEHIKGSLYRVQLGSGEETFASNNKSSGEWRFWRHPDLNY